MFTASLKLASEYPSYTRDKDLGENYPGINLCERGVCVLRRTFKYPNRNHESCVGFQ